MKVSFFLLGIIIITNCDDIEKTKLNDVIITSDLNKDAYFKGDSLSINIELISTEKELLVIDSIYVTIKNILKPLISKEIGVLVADGITISSHEKRKLKKTLVKEISSDFEDGSYGIYFSYKVNENKVSESYQTFFRVIRKDEITVFDIETDCINEFPIYKLDGGMSAEYTIEKSIENLTSGISHSWKVNGPGLGPNHVLSSPNFLKKSVKKTVYLYNKILGENTPINTVMISSGFSSIPYIANSLKAVVLPLHFLVSVNTVKEIQTILKVSNDSGLPSYACLSHDSSMPYAVSWIKLMNLPKSYKTFLRQHKVKEVIILGVTGVKGGETKAKEILPTVPFKGNLYDDRSIYIMYPGTSSNELKTLNDKIVDLKEFKQSDDFYQISDWESGINQRQLDNFTKDLKAINESISINTITSKNLIDLYLLGTYSTLNFMKKNKSKCNKIRGVTINPYLISHPYIELKKGFIPLLYWQLVNPNHTVHNLENKVFDAIKYFYPKTNIENMILWLNCTRNFGSSWSAKALKKVLIKKGYRNIRENNYQVDEIWDLSNKENAPCELLYTEVRDYYGVKEIKKWNNSLKPLNIEDFKHLAKVFGGFQVEAK